MHGRLREPDLRGCHGITAGGLHGDQGMKLGHRHPTLDVVRRHQSGGPARQPHAVHQVTEGAFDADDQDLSGDCGDHATGPAFEESRAEQPFHLPDRLGQRRLREVHLLRSGAHAAHPADLRDRTQVPQVQCQYVIHV